jgi:hypothetical protein
MIDEQCIRGGLVFIYPSTELSCKHFLGNKYGIQVEADWMTIIFGGSWGYICIVFIFLITVF